MRALTVLVTVRGPSKTLDVELPADVPIGELMPILLEMCSGEQNDPRAWDQIPASLCVVDASSPLSSDATLVEADVYAGAVLVLAVGENASLPRGNGLMPRQSVARSLPPSISTGGIGVTWEALT